MEHDLTKVHHGPARFSNGLNLQRMAAGRQVDFADCAVGEVLKVAGIQHGRNEPLFGDGEGDFAAATALAAGADGSRRALQ